ncbi:hypothetical protein D6810_01520, partial [Candidatus Dojkabacteria bacterium]
MIWINTKKIASQIWVYELGFDEFLRNLTNPSVHLISIKTLKICGSEFDQDYSNIPIKFTNLFELDNKYLVQLENLSNKKNINAFKLRFEKFEIVNY